MYKFNERSGTKVQNAQNQVQFGDLSIICVMYEIFSIQIVYWVDIDPDGVTNSLPQWLPNVISSLWDS